MPCCGYNLNTVWLLIAPTIVIEDTQIIINCEKGIGQLTFHSQIALGNKVTPRTWQTHGPGLADIKPVTLEGCFVDPGELHKMVRVRAIYQNFSLPQGMC
jgi:hypothetical protein